MYKRKSLRERTRKDCVTNEMMFEKRDESLDQVYLTGRHTACSHYSTTFIYFSGVHDPTKLTNYTRDSIRFFEMFMYENNMYAIKWNGDKYFL